jgi:ribonuclease M5
MIKIRQAVIVEGKYDKIKLSSIVDAPIICTEGFGIFKDKERQNLIRMLAERRGIVVLTDSDSAGFIIRNFIGSTVDKKYIVNAYIPDIFGKEKRKDAPSREGKLGVEGVSEKVITQALERAGVLCENTDAPARPITKHDLYELGLSGKKGSVEKRKKLLDYYKLPSRLTSNSLIPVLNSITDYDCLLDDLKIMEGIQVCCE